MAEKHRSIFGFASGRIHQWIRLVVIVLGVLAPSPGWAASFSVAMDQDTVLLGDTATLSLTFDGVQPQGTPQLPPIPGLEFTGVGQSSAYSFGMGRNSSSVTYNYGIKPTRTGDFTIPALTIKINNETLTSQPLSFKVVRALAPEPGSEAEQQQLAFLRMILPKKEAFVGETVVLELQLLINGIVQNHSAPEIPSLEFDGCTTGRAVVGNVRQAVVGAKKFKAMPISVPITIMKPGALNFGPVDGSIVVELPSRSGQRDVFDPFGMFTRGVQQRVSFSAPSQILTALPLPEAGKPATFSGAVGTFQMAVSAGPTNVAVGDPITIRVQINGRGALDSFNLPDQPAWKEFKTYPPTVKTETTGDLALHGTKSFEQVVVPQNTEIKELPPFEFSYFDPEQRSYRTLLQRAMPIIVRPSGLMPSPMLATGTKPADIAPAALDIVHIKPRLVSDGRNSIPWVRQAWFLALQAVPVLGLVVASVWRKHRDALASNPRRRRQREVEQGVRKGLVQLKQLAANQDSDAFFATIFRLLQEQIGERLDMPASAITEAIVDEKLRAHGITESAADSLHELFQRCNQARYAPVESAQQLEAMIPKTEFALRALQGMKE